MSKAAARRAVPATAASAPAATPSSTPVSPPTSTPTRTPVTSAHHVESIGQDGSVAPPSSTAKPCPTTGRGRATALRAGAARSITKARDCSAQSTGVGPIPSASHQPRCMSSEQANVQSAARPAAPKLPGGRGTRASKAAMTATATRAAAGGVMTRSRAAATAAQAPPATAAAQTDTKPVALSSQHKKGSLKAEAPTRVQPKRAVNPVWR
ncbi:hypothetical protein ABBQ38_000928 [Trebouxia sp. C0009 RCD-2024]